MPQAGAGGLRHLTMHGAVAGEEGAQTAERLVDELVHDDQIPGGNVRLQGTDGTAGDHGVYAELLQGEEVCGVGHFAG